MGNLKSKSVVMVLTVLALLVVMPALAQTNLLANGNMEGGFDGNGVPNGWQPWYIDAPSDCNNYKPVYSHGAQAQEGSAAAMFFINWHTYTAGLRQTVNVTPGNNLRFTAYGRIVSGDTVGTTVSNPNAGVEMKIGIDPTGGSNPQAGTVVWSGTISATGGYQLFSVDATAQNSSVTVFLYSRPFYCNAENTTFFDNASLVVAGQGSTSGGAAAPTSPPVQNVSIEKAPPRADGSVVHVVQPNQYLNLIAGTYGVTIQQIKELNGLTSNIIYTGQELLVIPAEGAGGGEGEGEGEGEEGNAGGEGGAPPSPDAPALPTVPPEAIAAAGAEAATGNLCVLVFDDRNRNGSRDPGEGLLAGARITLSGPVSPVSYTTTGISPNEPYCFMGLAPDNYDLSFAGPDLASVSPANVRLAVPAGQTVRVEHGAVSLTAGAGDELAASAAPRTGLPAPTVRRLGLATLGAAGAMLAMTVLGGIIYLAFLRKP
ncbi:MAG: LysM peptidoglycan-binding domain-containing protein [Anaerolineae bacterium]|nr:LysM peptidoglycan-binding domain-containing protein [Anaerolineae bacterium]